ncbi:MAG: rhodanese-like domain-containing protein [Propionibacteriaceae bacterium]|nr:rhodanese-like domain-containing protein [Propionibacteriaceae bacterium]
MAKARGVRPSAPPVPSEGELVIQRRTLLALLPISALAGLTACAAESPESSGSSGDGPPENGATLDADGFAAAVEQPDTVVLDVRSPEEYAQGHLPGAVNIDVNGADFEQRIAELDKTVPYAVYCRSGSRSATAVDIMAGQGFTSTYHLDGGIGAWTSSGRAVVR